VARVDRRVSKRSPLTLIVTLSSSSLSSSLPVVIVVIVGDFTASGWSLLSQLLHAVDLGSMLLAMTSLMMTSRDRDTWHK